MTAPLQTVSVIGLGYIGLPPRLIHLCYSGIDLSPFHESPRLRLEQLREASIVLGSVCQLREEKGLSLLLAAFKACLGGHRVHSAVLIRGLREKDGGSLCHCSRRTLA